MKLFSRKNIINFPFKIKWSSATLVSLLLHTTLFAQIQLWKVREVNFLGNETFSRSELLSLMELKPRWPRYNIKFSDGALRSDIKMIKNYYQDQGFLSAEVTPSTITRDSSNRNVHFTIAIIEGPRTKIKSIQIETSRNTQIIEQPTSRHSVLKSKIGKPLIRTTIDKDCNSLSAKLANYGYLESKVLATTLIDSARHEAVVIFKVNEGPIIRVGDIKFKGVKGLRQRVITRELQFELGDTLTSKKILSSEKKLYRTGLFSLVQIKPVVGDTQTTKETFQYPDSAYPVSVTVDETDFFRIETGVGYGTDEGARASMKTSYGNLWALGHKISLNGKLSTKQQEGSVSYFMPWLYKIPLQFTQEFYYTRYSDEDYFEGVVKGLRLSLGKQEVQGLSYLVSLKFEDVPKTNVLNSPAGDTISRFKIVDKNTQSISFNLIYDKRNDLFLPSKGFINSFDIQIAGLTGDNSYQFVKVQDDFRFYKNFKRIVFGSAIHLGWSDPYGETTIVPEIDRFRGGGARSVRGFKDNFLNDSGAGNVLAEINLLEIRFPIKGWFHGAVFADAGYVWQTDKEFSSLSSFVSDLRYTSGFGLRIHTPLAIIRADMGFKLDRRPSESLYEIHFDIGQSF